MSCSGQDFSYYCPKQQRKVFFDYYALLNVSKDASEEQIRKAYRKLAFLYHPDKCNNGQKEISKEKFKIIGDAYQNLLCPEKRSLYNSVLLKMELKQNAKKQNPQGFCSLLQNCSRDDLIYFLVGSYACKPTANPQEEQFFECSQQKADNYYKQQNSAKNASYGWHDQQDNGSSSSSSTMNTNYGGNAQNNGFSDDDNASEESEGEPQCQGSDASSNSSEQNFFQKFSFFNIIKSEQLDPENFTLLKGLFSKMNCNQQSSNACNDEFSQRFKQYQQQARCQASAQPNTDFVSAKMCPEQFQQGEENTSSINNNCTAQQSDSTNYQAQFTTKLEDMECEHQNDDDISTNQKDEEEEVENMLSNKCKNRLTKAHIKHLQFQNQNKKIIERIRNKKPVFSTSICKRIKKQQ